MLMKMINCLAVAVTVAMVSFAAVAVEPEKGDEKKIQSMNQYQEYVLVQGEIFKVYVKKDDGTTTVTFPSAISKIAGVNVSVDGSTDFQISAQPGGYYFNLVALREGATGTLTVVFNRKTYILYLIQDNEKAFAAVNFTGGSGSGSTSNGGSGAVTPARLLSLIDMAKAYDVLKKRYPTELRDSVRSTKKAVFRFEKFTMELQDVIRFNHEDTLVFRILMKNDTEEEILYDKFSFSVQAGNRTYYMSAADATGVMPPKSSSYAFFTITGTPEGRRNNLAADNEFRIGVTAQYMDPEPAVVVPASQEAELPSISETEAKIKKIEADFDKRLDNLLATMEETLARIERQEAANKAEQAKQQEEPIQITEPEPVQEESIAKEDPALVIVSGTVSSESDTQPEGVSSAENEEACDVVEAENASWWDFSKVLNHLAFLINWMPF